MADREVPRLDELDELLRSEAVPRGLISRGDAPKIWERHIMDCLRAVGEVRTEDRTSYDLGSGAGLPGLVVALACPGLEVTLVERRQSRAAFLELAVEKLELTNARVWAGDVRGLRTQVDICFARAFAPVLKAWQIARPLLVEGGRLIYFAGEGFADEGLPGARVTKAPQLASWGPLVIMSR